MPQFSVPQPSSADVRRSFPSGHLRIKTVPVGAEVLIGQNLLGQALTVVGTYTCDVETYDWAAIEVHLKPSAVSGTFAPTLAKFWANGVAVRTGSGHAVAGSNFGAGTAQTLTLTDLRGTIKCQVTFTIPGGGSITFANTTPATPTSLAEYNGQ